MLFQGSIGRTDLPGCDHADADGVASPKLLDTLPDETGVLPGPHGPDDARPRAPVQPVPARARRPVSKFQTPRGTYDVLPDHAAERDRLEQTAEKILERAGYGRIETPTFEATELFARGVGEATDVVQKEMFTFGDEEDSYTLRPEGTAPIVRSYLEHGMHKLPQPVKLWYLSSSFFRYERPQAGRFRQFWQIGAEAIGSPDPAVDAEVILLLGGAAGGDRRARHQARARHARPARLPRRLPRGAQGVPARQRGPAVARRSSSRIDLNPLRAFDAKHESTQRVMAKAPRLIDRLPQEDLDHFAEVQDLLQAADLSYTVDTTLVRGLDYYTRTLFEFQSGALEAAQNTLGGGGRYDGLAEAIGGPPTPGIGWAAGVERMLMASTQPQPVEAAGRPVRRLRARATSSAAFKLAADARRAGHIDKTRTRRPQRQGPAQAGLAHPSLATLPSSATKASSCATATAARTSSSRPKPSCTTSGERFETTTRQPVPRRLGRGAGRRAGGRARARGRLGQPPARPRRRHLHRPARPLRDRPADVPPRVAVVRARREAAPRARADARPARSSSATSATSTRTSRRARSSSTSPTPSTSRSR